MITQVWYHANCLDGFGAAYAAWEKFGDDALYVAVQYGHSPPEVDLGDEVYILDFSYDYDTIREIGKHSNKVVVLDHHKTAFENLEGKPYPTNIKVYLDMKRSGAIMAWDFFHPLKIIPPLLLYIQDRDLWVWDMTGTKEITAGLDSYPKTFEKWEWAMVNVGRLYDDGVAISRYRQQQIDILLNAWSRNPVYVRLNGKTGPLINGPYFLASELLNQLGQGHPFAANMITTGEGMLFSLRSTENGADVAEIARKYGGGGHKHASGFKLNEKDFAAIRDANVDKLGL